ncbi:MAG: ATP-binding cassette domain-containing protein [Francisellaceae bacterium]|jgi:ATP-binding cassette, subfamily C, bacterial LapB|nr:ATP-binding cassette domain-containing protein [Francisellaceae bacterium]MBT6207148.1 ATP-binding cassette domain-containing protein [Francisellaceae bacterium]MBT6539276.1 ATP-binding cassette domain-containing protein [Francisellaceae bacterium]
MLNNDSFQKIAEPNELSVILPHILSHFGIKNNNHVLECLPENKEHISLNTFRVTLAKLGVGTRVENKKTKYMKEFYGELPWLIISAHNPIIFVTKQNSNSYTYYEGITGKQITTNNLPISGKIQILVFYSTSYNNLIDKNTSWHKKLMYRYKTSFFSLFLASTFLASLGLLIPLAIMILYDVIIPTKSINLLYSVGFGLSIISLSGFIVDIFRNKMVIFLNLRINATINELIINKLVSLPAKMTENTSIASQILKLKDLSSVHNFFIKPWFASLFELPGLLIMLATIGVIGKLLIIFPIIATILHLILFYFFKQYNMLNSKNSFLLNDKHLNNTAETFTHVQTIRYHGREDSWAKQYQSSNHSFCRNSFKKAKAFSLTNSLSGLIMFINVIAISLTGAYLVGENAISVGALLACMILGWMSLLPFKNLLSFLFYINPLQSQLNQIQKLLTLPSEYDPYYPYATIDKFQGEIIFKDTSFKYHGDSKPAIKNLNIAIPAKSFICISGSNGSGKSTLLKLLTRLYEVQVGAVFIDRTNIKQHSIIEYQQNIGYLPERISVLPGRISDILRYDNQSATTSELYIACKKANIFRDIQRLPDGFETRLENSEHHIVKTDQFLKKIYLARLFVKKPSIYLLDEPTSYLSPADIKILLKELDNLRSKATIIVVTHLPELFPQADGALVLDEGTTKFFGNMKKFHNLNSQNVA